MAHHHKAFLPRCRYGVVMFFSLVIFIALSMDVVCFSNTQQQYTLPRGSYHLEFLAKSRSETGLKYQYSVTSILTISTEGRDSSELSQVRLVARENPEMGQNTYEYSSSSSSSVASSDIQTSLILYMGDSSSACFSLDISQPATLSINDLNRFVSSLRLVKEQGVPLSISHHFSYDRTVTELLKSAGLVAWIGSLSSPNNEEEHILLFTTVDGVPKYMLGQHLYISFTKFETIYPDELHLQSIHQMENTKKQLKQQCISLTTEIGKLFGNNTSNPSSKRHQYKRAEINNRTNKNTSLPWYMKVDESCSFHYIGDHERCQRAYKHRKHASSEETIDLLTPSPLPGSTTARKVCIFLHGAGNLEHNMPPSDTFVRYWGDITKYTPQCSRHLFVRTDTKNYGWDSVNLQEEYCKLAVYHNSTHHPDNGMEGSINNTIVFTHSMGNLILAAALKNGVCKFDKTSSKWYAIDAPFGGSHASSKVQEICEQYYNNSTFPISLRKLYGFLATKGGYCKPGTAEAYYAYKVCDPEYCNQRGECLSDLKKVIVDNVDGLMCGLSPIGLASEYSILLQVLSAVVNFGEQNDGMLGKSSCEKYHSSSRFTNNYRDAFYRTELNHADGTCRNGNGMFNDGRKPCSFYSYRV